MGPREEDHASAEPTPRSAYLLDWWSEARRHLGRIPSRRDLDPLDLGRLLGWLFLAEELPGRETFRFRLYGTLIADALGKDGTGQVIGPATFGAQWREISDLYARTLASHQPVVSRERIDHPAGFNLHIEVAHVPLAPAIDRPAMILGAFTILNGERTWRIPERSEMSWTILDGGRTVSK